MHEECQVAEIIADVLVPAHAGERTLGVDTSQTMQSASCNCIQLSEVLPLVVSDADVGIVRCWQEWLLLLDGKCQPDEAPEHICSPPHLHLALHQHCSLANNEDKLATCYHLPRWLDGFGWQ